MAYVSLYCAVFFLTISVLIHFLQTELNPIAEPLSRYAVDGQYSFLMISGFLAFGMSELLLALLLDEATLGAKLLFWVGIAMLLVGIFPMDIGQHHTWVGYIHTVAATIQLMLFPCATLMIAHSQPQGVLKIYSFLTGGMTLSFFILLVFAYFQASRFFGFIQKFDIFFITTWVVVVSASQISAPLGGK